MQFSDIKCDVCEEGLVSCILSEVALMKAFLFDTTMPSYCKNQFSTPNSQTHTHTYTTVTPPPKKNSGPYSHLRCFFRTCYKDQDFHTAAQKMINHYQLLAEMYQCATLQYLSTFLYPYPNRPAASQTALYFEQSYTIEATH